MENNKPTFEKVSFVQHVLKTSDCKYSIENGCGPKGCGGVKSWIEQWKRGLKVSKIDFPTPSNCYGCDCSAKMFGCHVFIPNDDYRYIAPLCKDCNEDYLRSTDGKKTKKKNEEFCTKGKWIKLRKPVYVLKLEKCTHGIDKVVEQGEKRIIVLSKRDPSTKIPKISYVNEKQSIQEPVILEKTHSDRPLVGSINISEPLLDAHRIGRDILLTSLDDFDDDHESGNDCGCCFMLCTFCTLYSKINERHNSSDEEEDENEVDRCMIFAVAFCVLLFLLIMLFVIAFVVWAFVSCILGKKEDVKLFPKIFKKHVCCTDKVCVLLLMVLIVFFPIAPIVMFVIYSSILKQKRKGKALLVVGMYFILIHIVVYVFVWAICAGLVVLEIGSVFFASFGVTGAVVLFGSIPSIIIQVVMFPFVVGYDVCGMFARLNEGEYIRDCQYENIFTMYWLTFFMGDGKRACGWSKGPRSAAHYVID